MKGGRRRRANRSRVLEVDRLRFAAGRRLLPDPFVVPDLEAVPATPKPSIVVDIVRAEDLVSMTVEGYEIDVVAGPDPCLVPREGEDARLVVRFPFQHLGEEAIFEGPVLVPDEGGPGGKPLPDDPPLGGPDARHSPPIQGRPAKTSRLVFEVPPEEEIPFTVEGILDALGRLPMLVHPLAGPKKGFEFEPVALQWYHIAPGRTVALASHGLVTVAAEDTTGEPGRLTADRLLAFAREGRRLRSLLGGRASKAPSAGGDPSSRPATVTLDKRSYKVPRLVVSEELFAPDDWVVKPIPLETLSRPPEQFETSIEAPFRLVISPSDQGGWAHSRVPVGAEDAPHRVELWHSRLGVRKESAGGAYVDEDFAWQRIVRAIWARDRDKHKDWKSAPLPHDDTDPFRTSLDPADRNMLVRQSAETWRGVGLTLIKPTPVDADALWLSSLGAWLNLHGTWDTEPYSAKGLASILLWDHIAPLGRDQFVRVVYPGYLFPFGHRATLVKVTERKMKDATNSVAGLYQRMFIVVNEPVRTYGDRELPFTEVRLAPVVTPPLAEPDAVPGESQDTYFWPRLQDGKFPFELHCRDHESRPVKLVASLLWVAEHYFNADSNAATNIQTEYSSSDDCRVAANGQDIAFAPVSHGGDTLMPTTILHFEGEALPFTSSPKLAEATVELPAVQQLSPVGGVEIRYNPTYTAYGFSTQHNLGEVWADLVTAKTLTFGASTAAGSERAGGFLQPDIPIRSLSRKIGLDGDPARTAAGQFDPTGFLNGVLPKLFGLVPLSELLDAVGVNLDQAPTVVSEMLDRIEGFICDLKRVADVATEARKDAERLKARAASKTQELRDKAEQAYQKALKLEADAGALVQAVTDAIGLLAGESRDEVQNRLGALLTQLAALADDMEAAAVLLPPFVRNRLMNLASVLRAAAKAVDIIDDIYRFVNQIASSEMRVAFRYEWRPKIQSWGIAGDTILEVPSDGLLLAVDGRASGKDGMAVEVLAELRDFSLILLPGETLVRFDFDHLSFHGGSSGKAEVDVVLQEIHFLGILSFIEKLKDLIPFDGFSDPPYVDVSSEGLTAGFTLALPNVAIGVFSLSNISLGADVRVPFLGDSVTVGFNFCTRERPFTLAVSFIGGGGWFMLRLAPKSLEIFELGLEAGAVLSVDFGVASGSVSAMLGIYMRLEGDAGSLTGYFRLRGEVDVLCIVSASIELYLELHYEFDTGKMVGRAELTIKIEVLFFSGSVTIECERRFAGSRGDPSFKDVMVLPDGTSPAWSEYCIAFAGA